MTDDLGKDLATVESLIRKHEELERDISAIDAKLEVRFDGAVDAILSENSYFVYGVFSN